MPSYDNPYVRRLMIVDHVRELHHMYDQYKAKQITWEDMQRELMDLRILLDVEFYELADSKYNDLYAKRIHKFHEKAGSNA